MRENAKWFWIVISCQAAFLLAWAARHEYLRTTAPTILLKVHPADPRDPIRGDFMALQYDINRVPKPVGETEELRNRTLYVILEQQGDYFEAVGTSRTYPALKPGQIAVLSTENWRQLDVLRANYGIESFFVPEGKGTVARDSKLAVRAAVSPAHRLYIKDLLVNGVPFSR